MTGLGAAALLTTTPVVLGVLPAGAGSGAHAFLDQCANGPTGAPTVCASPNDGTWINGNLNPSKSHYGEGDYVPFRTLVTGLATGSSTTHTITIQWDTLQGVNHAYDYLGSYNTTVTGAEPGWDSGITVGLPTTTFGIPVDTGQTQNQPSNQVLTLFGGTITGVSGYSTPAPGTRSVTVSFTANVADVILAWGGHVASEADWGSGKAAATVPGSAYHMALVSLDGNTVGSQDRSLKVDQAVAGPALSLDKSTTTVSFAKAGDTISYTYVLTNIGTVGLHPTYSVTDSIVQVTCPGGPNPLAPQASVTCGPVTYTVLPADVSNGFVTNTATASASYQGQPVTSDPDTVTVPLIVQNPALSLAKAASPTYFTGVGQSIAYAYTLTNSGNVTLSAPYAVTDDKVGVNCPTSPATLAPGASVQCSSAAPYVTTSADVTATSVVNHATATAKVGGGTVTSPEATSTVLYSVVPPPGPTPTSVPPVPALSVAKSASPASYDRIGQAVTYHYTLTNTGNVALSGPFSVNDSRVGVVGCGSPTTLAVGASITCSATYTVTAADMTANSIENVARGSATSNGAPVLSGPVTVTIGELHPGVAITKNASPDAVRLPGGDVTFTYVVTNSGDTVLTGVSVTDDVLGEIGSVASLAPGHSATFTKTVFIGAGSPARNTGVARGSDPLGTVVEGQASETLTIVAGEVIIRPVTPTTPTAAPTPATPVPSLAFTGVPVVAKLLLGAWLTLTGWVLLRSSRLPPRRRSHQRGA